MGTRFSSGVYTNGVLHQQFPQVPIIALTATADKITREDIIRQLHLIRPRTFYFFFRPPQHQPDSQTGISDERKK